MNEIIIDEKKYISSKQAARITGYAKDYIGQLCREGRVPARLVGRSWYVLETAIKDHRFGNQSSPDENSENTLKTPEEIKSMPFPRYESDTSDVLPSLNLLRNYPENQKDSREREESKKEPERLYSTSDSGVNVALTHSWNELFKRSQSGELELPIGEDKTENAKTASEEVFIPETAVPIHMFRNTLPDKVFMPIRQETASTSSSEASEPAISHAVVARVRQVRLTKNKRHLSRMFTYTRVALILIGFGSILFTVLSSGYFDGYATSINGDFYLPGVSIYNK